MFKPENKENDFFHRLGFSFDPSMLSPGKILISEPFLADPNFSRSVVLLCDYNQKEGAFGFVINKPTELEMLDIAEGFHAEGFPFHYGGPVDQETLYFIHTMGDVVPDSRPFLGNLSWSGDLSSLLPLINLEQVKPDQVRFMGGYSGWSKGQLESEIKEKSWIIGSLSSAEIMQIGSQDLWRYSLKHMGAKFSIMADFPENPELN